MFRWRRKGRTGSNVQPVKKKKRTLPAVVFPSLAEAIDDGMLLAMRIVRLEVKNAIIKRTIGDRNPFEAGEYRAAVDASLDKVLKELNTSADRVTGVRDRVRPGRSLSAHDYRQADVETLAFRAESSRGVSERIEAQRQESAFLDSLIEQARADAWVEISGHIEREMLDPWSKGSPRMQLPTAPETDREHGQRLGELEKEIKKLARDAKIQARRDERLRERD